MPNKARNDLLNDLYNTLWQRYLMRVPYAETYRQLVKQHGGTIVNDHIALRTLNTNTGEQPAGIEAIARLITPFGYTPIEQYIFTQKKLTAWHYEHELPKMPKIFISQLEVKQLPQEAQDLIANTVTNTKDPLAFEDQQTLKQIESHNTDNIDINFIERIANCFSRPWDIPKRSTIETLNKTSQYAAWVLLHGNSINHFTAYINEQNVPDWPNIETTVNGLIKAGVPMKAEIEGEPGSKLRQSATKAVTEACDVIEESGNYGKIDWSYAYYELAERGLENGKLFQAFLGEQATHLFDMTQKEV